MAVHLGMQWLAIKWTGSGRSVQHFDLVRVPDGTGGYRYGIFSQPEGEGVWKEQFDEGEALARLQVWVQEDSTPIKCSQSSITAAGRTWPASVT